ncbi:type II secretion system protein [Planococcus shenhongbingii]|uniref:type IV pilus modification PilV family protein n=1 Tax=Planococcus shenhongbingii TaxID=3058398 RepID=UPI0026170A4C|nr:type II secretion system protein [Planococcus sp. N016]WKA59999.1 type II secretion system protein [Planococcus sp. N016]
MKRIDNEKGFTLVEVLAALAILGIVFAGIMTIFPQMTLFNNKTEAKLDTMNLARQEMAKIITPKSPLQWVGKRDAAVYPVTGYQTFKEKVPQVLPLIPVTPGRSAYAIDSSIPASAGFVRYKKNDGYTYEVDIYLQCEPYKTTTSTGVLPCDNPDLPQLYKIHLKVFKGNQLSSETYSYIKFIVEKLGG